MTSNNSPTSSSLMPMTMNSNVAENLRNSRDRLAIEEAETDLRLDIVKTHRRQFEQILTIHLERILMSSAAQKKSLFEILTGSPSSSHHHNHQYQQHSTTSPSSSPGTGRGGGSATAASQKSPTRRLLATSSSTTSSPTSPTSSKRNVHIDPSLQDVSHESAARRFASTPTSHRNLSNLESASFESAEDLLRTKREPSPGHIQCKRLFAGASAKSLGRMARVIPMEIPNTNDTRRKNATFKRLRQEIAAEQFHLQEFQEAEKKRRLAYEQSRDQLFRKTEEKSLRDRLKHDLAMKRRPPDVGIEKAVSSDAKMMRVEERKRQRSIALQALADTRRQIWSRTHTEVDWAKNVFVEQERDLQSEVHKTVLSSTEYRKRTNADLNDVSVIANIHRRTHRSDAKARRDQITNEQNRLLNHSRAVTERNFESTGITVQTIWEEQAPPMPPTGRTKKAAEISDTTYDRLCGTPRAPIPKFAGATDALKHMSSTSWDALSELQHDSRLRALEFARFHSAGKMPPVSWK